MIRKWRDDWIKKQEAKWQAEYETSQRSWQEQISQLEYGSKQRLEKLQHDQESMDEMAKRVLDRKQELERVSNELRDQIRLLEAKASPSSVWGEAFSSGFSKAWDMMLPVMQSGNAKLIEYTKEQTIDQALSGLDGIVRKRIQQAESVTLKLPHEILAKRREFEQKLLQAKTDERRAQLNHYLEMFDWLTEVSNGNPVHTD